MACLFWQVRRSAALQMWDVPSAWSLKDAATVPVAYMTAYYALLIRGALQKHHTVLVHSGTGAVGMAAIRICHHRGCEVGVSRCSITPIRPSLDPHWHDLNKDLAKAMLQCKCHA